jgi:DNA primase
VDDRDAIYQANQDALIHWTSGANRHAAGTYLWRRGIDLDALPQNYQVGYARPGWAHLAEHVSNRAALLAAGLIVQTKNGRIIDRFRDRVMFPIRELDGRVAGYLGRSLSSSPDDTEISQHCR